MNPYSRSDLDAGFLETPFGAHSNLSLFGSFSGKGALDVSTSNKKNMKSNDKLVVGNQYFEMWSATFNTLP